MRIIIIKYKYIYICMYAVYMRAISVWCRIAAIALCIDIFWILFFELLY